MNILMVNPRGMYFEQGTAAYKRISYPMGLMSLSSAIKRIDYKNEDDWSVRENDNPNRKVTLIDAAAEGFGAEDGEGDTKITRNKKDIRVFGLSDEELLEKATAANPDVIFISALFTKQLDEVYAISKLLKDNFPDAVVVAGGIAATDLDKLPQNWDEGGTRETRNKTLQEPYDNGIDIVALGEGELTAVQLLNHIEQAENWREVNLSDVPNIRLKDDSQPNGVFETKRQVISREELNRLPFPDLSVVDKSLYSKKRAHFGEAKSDNWIELFTSRGCSKNCTFCATKPYFDCYRDLSLERVTALLEYYRENGYDEVCVEDDSILDIPKRAALIFNKIKELGFSQFTVIGGIEFKHLLYNSPEEKYYMDKLEQVGSSKRYLSESEMKNTIVTLEDRRNNRFVEMVDGKEIIDAMSSDIDEESGESKENGCYRIYLAMESANPETLEAIGKDREFPKGEDGLEKRRSEEEAIGMLHDSGIEAHGGLMMGNPQTEGIEELMKNIRFSRDMMEAGLGRIAFFPYVMLPGSHMSITENVNPQYARIREDFGYLSYGFDTTNFDSISHGWTAEELVTINIWANQLFSAGEGKNWQRGQTVQEEELEKQIEFISNRNNLKKLTEERLMAEGGDEFVQIYHEALQAINPKLLRESVPDLESSLNYNPEFRSC